MAYENIEKLGALLKDERGAALNKTISAGEKQLSELLKKLGELETAAGRGPEHHAGRTVNHCYHDSTFCQVEVNTSHATASVLMDTYAHTQDKPRLELAEKIEANFYTQDLTPAAPQPRQNEKPAATKISGKEILEAIRLMDAEERRELTRALFA